MQPRKEWNNIFKVLKEKKTHETGNQDPVSNVNIF